MTASASSKSARTASSSTSPMNGRVLLFGLAAAAITGVLAGLVPAWRVSQSELTPSLKETAPAGGLRHRSSRGAGALVAAQVALGLVLVTAAGLFAKTLLNLRRVDAAAVGIALDETVTRTDLQAIAGVFGVPLDGAVASIPAGERTTPSRGSGRVTWS